MTDPSSVTDPKTSPKTDLKADSDITALMNLLELLADLAVTESASEPWESQPSKVANSTLESSLTEIGSDSEILEKPNSTADQSPQFSAPQFTELPLVPKPVEKISPTPNPNPPQSPSPQVTDSPVTPPSPPPKPQTTNLTEAIANAALSNQNSNPTLNRSDYGSQSETVALTPSEPQDNWIEFERDISKPLERIHDLLVDLYAPVKFDQIHQLEEKVDSLDQIIHNPEQLTHLLVPLIGEILSLRVASSKQEVIEAIVPIIDSAIEVRSHHDRVAMSKALSTVIPGAITEQIEKNPEEIVTAIAPAMGKAISEQIRLERDSMVDALYPIIGNTISKYMGEAIREINRKVETTLSFEGVRRKIRAKMQGISEAELILREALPSNVKAIFLIHKLSGLVISEVQKLEAERLESDMLAGMLTAIRSFASECVIQPENTSELKEIQYDSFQIVMEVAGYCYIAVVCQGELSKGFISQLRRSFASIVLYHGRAIENFDGDPTTIPEAVHQLLAALLKADEKYHHPQKDNIPGLLTLIGLLIGASALFGGWQFYLNRHESKVLSELSGTPELALYRLEAKAGWKQLKLTGKLPNQWLKDRATTVAAGVLPEWTIDNQILAVKTPPDPVLIAQELKRLSVLMNQIQGVALKAQFIGDRIQVEGLVADQNRIQQLTQTFEEFFGENSVTLTLKPQQLPLNKRFYFESGSAQVNPAKMQKELAAIATFLKTYPDQQLRIIGHTDSEGTLEENRKLSQSRANQIKQLLIAQGIDRQRLQTLGIPQPPTDLINQPEWMGRCVRFEQVTLDNQDS